MVAQDRPLLRSGNALPLPLDSASAASSAGSEQRLVDVHLAVGSSGLSGGSAAIVQGSYEYSHYGHERVNDSGWGCAYRTLQTIASWFARQQYIAASASAALTHAKIQRALVEVGDKPASFVGSRQWIGAFELSLVLSHLFKLEAKILPLSSGAEFASKARVLHQHFATQGTPCMIGGNQLSFGLLGIDFNAATGDARFLILDPHYTGADNLNAIITKRWCAWHSADLFNKDTFYNVLLPQRPHAI